MKNKFLITFSTLTLLIGGLIACSPEKPLNNLEAIGPTPVEFETNNRGAYLGENVDTETTPNPDDTEDLTNVPTTLTIHYQMDPPADYTTKNFYLWAGKVDGQAYEPDGVDDFGMYITVNPKDYGPHNTFMFIIKNAGTWAGQSTDTEIPYDKFLANDDGLLEVWCIDGEPGVVDVYATKEETMGGKISYAKFEDWKTIKITGTVEVASYELYAFNSEYYLADGDTQLEWLPRYLITSGEPNATTFTIDLPRYVPANLTWRIKATFTDGKIKQAYVTNEKLYYTPRFEKFYTYQGLDLGATYSKEKTTFKVWAPTCGRVELRVYDVGTPRFINPKKGSDFFKYYLMNYNAGGVWSCEVPGDLNGKYYTFYVQNTTGSHEICDPYAKSAGINGLRSMVLDFDSTDPEGWDKIPTVWDGVNGFDLEKPSDLSVYEIHIRDLTMDDTWGGKEKAGTFNAFKEKGTTYSDGATTVKTGFDHIEELGVNAIQILPFFDQANSEIDEDLTNNKMDINYNWGYNPLNYNVVEGAYSSDPYDGAVRVKELKEVVQAYALNENNTRVIMDVVYNHVASVSANNLNKIMPKYYFRMTKDGYYADGAGCGNEVKTEATMMRKFIVDSVTWWASEYKIKGFRFDLMGLIDVETMRQVKDAVYAVDPDNVCYGEGWSLGYNGAAGTEGSHTDNVYKKLGQTKDSPGLLGGFSDGFRNAIRGGNDQGWGTNNPLPGWGLISQGHSDVGDKAKMVGEGVLGKHIGKGDNPYQTVNYASCHDNWTLYDQLHWTLSDDGGKTQPEFAALAEGILAVQSAVAFSSGIAFFQSGEELFRTKIDLEPVKEGDISYVADMYGLPISHNSYKSSDETNALKYDQKISVTYDGEVVKTNEYFNKYCEMIHARDIHNTRLTKEENTKHSKANVWYSNGKADGSTGFAVYNGHVDGYNYYFFFAGREKTSFGFGAYDKCEFVYSSIGETAYDFTNTINLAPRQFLVLREKLA